MNREIIQKFFPEINKDNLSNLLFSLLLLGAFSNVIILLPKLFFQKFVPEIKENNLSDNSTKSESKLHVTRYSELPLTEYKKCHQVCYPYPIQTAILKCKTT